MKNKALYLSFFIIAISVMLSPLPVAAEDTLPITLTRDDGLCDNLDFSDSDWRLHYFYTSPVYHLKDEVKKLRFTVTETTSNDRGGGYPCFALAEFFIYDGNGNQITLSARNFSTNAQEPKEGPMRNICDNNYGTFFHSLWSYLDESTGPHYIEVSLPRSMKEFSFAYVSRYENVAPSTIIIDDAVRLEEEENKEKEELERYENHTDTLLCEVNQVVKGHEWDIDLILQSSDDYVRYTALQMDIIPITEGLTGEGVDFSFLLNKDRLPSHEVAIGKGDWISTRVVIYSMSLDSIRGLDGTLIHMHLASKDLIPAGRYVFYIANIRLTTVDKRERLLNAIQIAVVSTDPDEPEKNSIYLTSVGADGMAKLSSTEAKPGERIYLRANPTSEWIFKRWMVEEDDVTINDPEATYTYFLMPEHDVHITAVFEVNGIDIVTAAGSKSVIHTLDGRRTDDHPSNGIFIISGKKVLLR